MFAKAEIVFLARQKNVPSEDASVYRRPTEYILTLAEEKITSLLVPKVAHSGKDHRHAMFVCGGNYLVISHRPTWLNHTANASSSCIINTVAEGEEGI